MSGGGVKDCTDDFMVEDAAPARGQQQQEAQRETDRHRIAQRTKQIDLGKNTLGYQRYRQAVPRQRRDKRKDPMTPDVHQLCSKRAFEGQVKKWRRQLHVWDPPEEGSEAAVLPVHTDAEDPARNPAPPAEPSDDFEHVTHADAAGHQSRRTSPNKAGRMRPEAPGRSLRIPSAMRKRSHDETQGMTKENRQPLRNQAGQGAPHGAKQQRLSGEEPAAAAAAPPSAPSWADQRFQDPELDYGLSDDDGDGGWQHVAAPPGRLPCRHTTVYNSALAQDDWQLDVQL